MYVQTLLIKQETTNWKCQPNFWYFLNAHVGLYEIKVFCFEFISEHPNLIDVTKSLALLQQ